MTKIHTLLITVCLAASFSLAHGQQQPDPNFELYILAGQSNMSGRGYITGEFKNEGDSQVYMLNKDNKWVLAKNPLHFDQWFAGVGPGLAFGIAMRKAANDPKIRIGLIPCAVGGTPIEHWLPGAYDPATNTHPYDDAVVRIKIAMQYGVIKGIIWHQGEANKTPEQARIYLAQLKELIERFRALVNDPKLPFIAGELGRFRPEFSGINNELTKLPVMVPYTAVATAEGLTHRGDTVHFDSPSADELGRRYAKKMLEVQKK
jgi:Carbohydrate esterase, sialic acid-specific acetylesterase